MWFMKQELDAGWILEKQFTDQIVVLRSAYLSLAARNYLKGRVLISFARQLCSFKVNTGKLALPMRPKYCLTCLLPTLFNPRIKLQDASMRLERKFWTSNIFGFCLLTW